MTPMAIAPPRPRDRAGKRVAMIVAGNRPDRRAPPVPHHSTASQNKRGGRLLCRPFVFDRMSYFRLVSAVRSAESLTMPAAPHQFEPTPDRIDRGDEGAGVGSIDVAAGREVAGEGVAVTLGQVGVGVAEVQREHLVGEADADVPGVVVGIVDAVRERPPNVANWCRRTSPTCPATDGRTHPRCTCRRRWRRTTCSARSPCR